MRRCCSAPSLGQSKTKSVFGVSPTKCDSSVAKNDVPIQVARRPRYEGSPFVPYAHTHGLGIVVRLARIPELIVIVASLRMAKVLTILTSYAPNEK